MPWVRFYVFCNRLNSTVDNNWFFFKLANALFSYICVYFDLCLNKSFRLENYIIVSNKFLPSFVILMLWIIRYCYWYFVWLFEVCYLLLMEIIFCYLAHYCGRVVINFLQLLFLPNLFYPSFVTMMMMWIPLISY